MAEKVGDKVLAWLAGLYLGDGVQTRVIYRRRPRRREYRVCLVNSDPWIVRYAVIVMGEFGLPYIELDARKGERFTILGRETESKVNVFAVTVSNRILCEGLHKPDGWLYKLSETHPAEFLHGWIDAEASPRRWPPYISGAFRVDGDVARILDVAATWYVRQYAPHWRPRVPRPPGLNVVYYEPRLRLWRLEVPLIEKAVEIFLRPWATCPRKLIRAAYALGIASLEDVRDVEALFETYNERLAEVCLTRPAWHRREWVVKHIPPARKVVEEYVPIAYEQLPMV